MNFKRIQWIFLVAFLIFDVVVVSTLFFQNRFTIASNSQGQQETIIKEMRSDAISCDHLSNHQSTGYYIAGNRSTENGLLQRRADSKLRDQDIRFNSGELVSTLDAPFVIDPQHPTKRLNAFVQNKHLVAFGKQYRYSQNLSDKNTVVYVQTYAGRPLYGNDSQIRFRVNAEHAVTWLYKHNMIPNNSQIRWTKLAYTKLASTNSHNQVIYIPTWVVEIKAKNAGTVQRLYVNAFNSTVMKASPDNINTETLNK